MCVNVCATLSVTILCVDFDELSTIFYILHTLIYYYNGTKPFNLFTKLSGCMFHPISLATVLQPWMVLMFEKIA